MAILRQARSSVSIRNLVSKSKMEYDHNITKPSTIFLPARGAQNLWEWPANVWFNLKSKPQEAAPTPHCLDGQEQETGY